MRRLVSAVITFTALAFLLTAGLPSLAQPASNAGPAYLDPASWNSVTPAETANIVYRQVAPVLNPAAAASADPGTPSGIRAPVPNTGPAGTMDLHLDVYTVPSAKPTPVVIQLHGGGWIQPHARWATGLLVDNCTVPDGGIDFMNRGEMGSGHGWTIGWAVAWNCRAKSFIIQQPPGAMNWAIGCVGQAETSARPFDKSPALPQGTLDSQGKPVAPASLYLTQLRERLGPRVMASPGARGQDQDSKVRHG